MGLGRGTAVSLGASPGESAPLSSPAARRGPVAATEPGTARHSLARSRHCIFACAALHVSEFPRGAGAALIGCIKGLGRLSALRTLGQ